MNDAMKAPAHLWAVGILSTLWNAFGAFNYVMAQMRNEDYLAGLSEAQRAYLESFPAWSEASWAVGVWGALLGSLLLLLRSRHAELAFAASLLGLLVTTLYQYVLSDAPAEMTSGASIGLSAAIWAVAIFLFVYARRMRAGGVLR